MAADENVFRRSILDVVGEVLRDLQATMTERALFRLDWLLDAVNRYADSLGTIVDLNQIHFLLREARDNNSNNLNHEKALMKSKLRIRHSLRSVNRN